MGSCNSGSGWIAGGVTNSGLEVGAGVVLGPAAGVLPVPVELRLVGEVHAVLSRSFPSSSRNRPHHLDARVGRRLLQAVVEKPCLVEYVARIF